MMEFRNFALSIPEEYRDQVLLEESGDMIKVIHIASKNTGEKGNIFTVYAIDSKDAERIEKVSKYEDVVYIDGSGAYTYFLWIPSGVVYPESECENYRRIFDSLLISSGGKHSLAPGIFALTN